MKGLFVSLLVLAVQYQCINCECSANMFGALKKCADSINNNEPFSIQQEMCTQADCNYDCPSSDKLDTLANKFETMFSDLQSGVIANILSTISGIQQNVSSNQESVEQLNENLQNLTLAVDNVTEVVNNITQAADDSGGALVDDPCGIGGQWLQVGYLDMTDSQTECPTGFRLYEEDGVRACGRQTTDSGSCHSKIFDISTSYTEVCGKVLGYQYTLPDAVWSGGGGGHNDIESYYVDGVSITYSMPRQHIWTFMAGRSESQNGGAHCPCNDGNNVAVAAFIGDDYYCESAVVVNDFNAQLHTHEQLWDGEDCHSNEAACCSKPNIPWFHKTLNAATTDDIELRVCADEGTSGEDSPVSFYAIYVK